MSIKIEEVLALGALSVACLYLVKRHPKEARVILDVIEGKYVATETVKPNASLFIGDS